MEMADGSINHQPSAIFTAIAGASSIARDQRPPTMSCPTRSPRRSARAGPARLFLLVSSFFDGRFVDEVFRDAGQLLIGRLLLF